ncbi:hypothetical protein IWQ60_011772 [Tieghemiomyces parasiticus]|uniref:Uncharacterized protein n=1 Tax=Tieghemiomyces parasiticus TaxID=78921 RepID=A0A9W7ZM88_9FUNG|nr:hypothetical protein IWQ60_011772 [Tieghemiomyces parasiticus]
MDTYPRLADLAFPHVSWPQTTEVETDTRLDEYEPDPEGIYVKFKSKSKPIDQSLNKRFHERLRPFLDRQYRGHSPAKVAEYENINWAREARIRTLQYSNVIQFGKFGNALYVPVPGLTTSEDGLRETDGPTSDSRLRRPTRTGHWWAQHDDGDANLPGHPTADPFVPLSQINCVLPLQHFTPPPPLPTTQATAHHPRLTRITRSLARYGLDPDHQLAVPDFLTALKEPDRDACEAAVWDYRQGLTAASVAVDSQRYVAAAMGDRGETLHLLPLKAYLAQPYPTPSPLFTDPRVPFVSTYKSLAEWSVASMAFTAPLRGVTSRSTAFRRMGRTETAWSNPDLLAVRSPAHVSICQPTGTTNPSSFTFRLCTTLAVGTEPLTAAFNPFFANELVVADHDRMVRLWDISTPTGSVQAVPLDSGAPGNSFLPVPDYHPARRWLTADYGPTPRTLWVADALQCASIDFRAPPRAAISTVYRIPGYNEHPDHGLGAVNLQFPKMGHINRSLNRYVIGNRREHLAIGGTTARPRQEFHITAMTRCAVNPYQAFVATHGSIFALDARAPHRPALWIDHAHARSPPRHMETWRNPEAFSSRRRGRPKQPQDGRPPETTQSPLLSRSSSHAESSSSDTDSHSSDSDDDGPKSIRQSKTLDRSDDTASETSRDDNEGCRAAEEDVEYRRARTSARLFVCNPREGWIESYEYHKARLERVEPESPLAENGTDRPRTLYDAEAGLPPDVDPVERQRAATITPGASCCLRRPARPNRGRYPSAGDTYTDDLLHYLKEAGQEATESDIPPAYLADFDLDADVIHPDAEDGEARSTATGSRTPGRRAVMCNSSYYQARPDEASSASCTTLPPLVPHDLPWAVRDLSNAVTPYRHHPAADLGARVDPTLVNHTRREHFDPLGHRYPPLSGLVIEPEQNLPHGPPGVRTSEPHYHVLQFVPTGAVFHQVYGRRLDSTQRHTCDHCHCHKSDPASADSPPDTCCETCSAWVITATDADRALRVDHNAQLAEIDPTPRTVPTYNHRLNVLADRRPAENRWLFNRGMSFTAALVLGGETAEDQVREHVYTTLTPYYRYLARKVTTISTKLYQDPWGVALANSLTAPNTPTTPTSSFYLAPSRWVPGENPFLTITSATETPDLARLADAIRNLAFKFPYPLTLAELGQQNLPDVSPLNLVRQLSRLDLKPLRVMVSPWRISSRHCLYPAGDPAACWNQIRAVLATNMRINTSMGRAEELTAETPSNRADCGQSTAPTAALGGLALSSSTLASVKSSLRPPTLFPGLSDSRRHVAGSGLFKSALLASARLGIDAGSEPSTESTPTTTTARFSPVVEQLLDHMTADILTSLIVLIPPASSADYLAHLELNCDLTETSIVTSGLNPANLEAINPIDRPPVREAFVSRLAPDQLPPLASRARVRILGPGHARPAPPATRKAVCYLHPSYLSPQPVPLTRGAAVIWERWKSMWSMNVLLKYHAPIREQAGFQTAAAYQEMWQRGQEIPPKDRFIRYASQQVQQAGMSVTQPADQRDFSATVARVYPPILSSSAVVANDHPETALPERFVSSPAEPWELTQVTESLRCQGLRHQLPARRGVRGPLPARERLLAQVLQQANTTTEMGSEPAATPLRNRGFASILDSQLPSQRELKLNTERQLIVQPSTVTDDSSRQHRRLSRFPGGGSLNNSQATLYPQFRTPTTVSTSRPGLNSSFDTGLSSGFHTPTVLSQRDVSAMTSASEGYRTPRARRSKKDREARRLEKEQRRLRRQATMMSAPSSQTSVVDDGGTAATTEQDNDGDSGSDTSVQRKRKLPGLHSTLAPNQTPVTTAADSFAAATLITTPRVVTTSMAEVSNLPFEVTPMVNAETPRPYVAATGGFNPFVTPTAQPSRRPLVGGGGGPGSTIGTPTPGLPGGITPVPRTERRKPKKRRTMGF